MLVFDPKKRITAEQALKHKYLEVYHNERDEVNLCVVFHFHQLAHSVCKPIAAEPFDWSFTNADVSLEDWKKMLYDEVNKQ